MTDCKREEAEFPVEEVERPSPTRVAVPVLDGGRGEDDATPALDDVAGLINDVKPGPRSVDCWGAID